jgi:hypothetical protein
MTINDVRLGDRLTYNDGRIGHVDVGATVIGRSDLSIVVQFDDRADCTLIRDDDRAWWDHLLPTFGASPTRKPAQL